MTRPGTFDIGNPNLTIETAKSVEIGLRKATGPLRFEATAYYTRFNNFIFRRLTGVMCDGDFDSCGRRPDAELKQAVYSQRDATFRGGEFQSQLDIAPFYGGIWGVEDQFDIVRATFTDGTNVPRIPPVRVGGGVFWRDANWLMRVNLLHAFAQNDIAVIGETPTAGYNLLKAEISYKTKLDPGVFRRPRNDGRSRRQQSVEREHPQFGLLHQGRGADAGHRRAGFCEFEILCRSRLISNFGPLKPILARGQVPRWLRSPALSRHAPVRPDRSGNIRERAIDEFGHQQAAVVDRSRHGRPALRNGLEADAAVIGFVADQHHEAMPFCFGILQRAIQQRAADAAAAKRRLDRQRPQQQRLGIADAESAIGAPSPPAACRSGP